MLDYIELKNDNHFIGQSYLYVKRNDDIYRYSLIKCKNVEIEKEAYIYLFVEENNKTYYCLPTKELRDMFVDLMEVKSVGLKTASLIVSEYSCDEFKDIVKNFEYNKLTELKGLGQLSAKIIIESLQEKWFDVKYSTKEQKLIQTLTRLGYSRDIVLKTIKTINNKLSEEESLKLLISQLGKGQTNNVETD